MATNPHPLVAMLAAYRQATGLGQRDLAAAMGTSQSAVSDLERGLTSPELETIHRYAGALGVRVTWGLSGMEATGRPNGRRASREASQRGST